jgi:hypothetical protein
MSISPYRDANKLRQRYIDACAKRGFAIVVRKMFRPLDLESGATTRCATCYDDVYKEASIQTCPVCFGTSFTGGYYEPVLTWGNLSDTQGHDLVDKAGAGEFEKEAGTGSLAYTPVIHEGDVIWQVDSYDDAGALDVLDLHVVTSGVVHNTIKGKLSGKQRGATDITDPTLIYQTFSHVLVPADDIRQTLAFR